MSWSGWRAPSSGDFAGLPLTSVRHLPEYKASRKSQRPSHRANWNLCCPFSVTASLQGLRPTASGADKGRMDLQQPAAGPRGRAARCPQPQERRAPLLSTQRWIEEGWLQDFFKKLVGSQRMGTSVPWALSWTRLRPQSGAGVGWRQACILPAGGWGCFWPAGRGRQPLASTLRSPGAWLGMGGHTALSGEGRQDCVYRRAQAGPGVSAGGLPEPQGPCPPPLPLVTGIGGHSWCSSPTP